MNSYNDGLAVVAVVVCGYLLMFVVSVCCFCLLLLWFVFVCFFCLLFVVVVVNLGVKCIHSSI